MTTYRITKKTDEVQRVREKKASLLLKMKMNMKMAQLTTKMTLKSSEKMNSNNMNSKKMNWSTRAMTPYRMRMQECLYQIMKTATQLGKYQYHKNNRDKKIKKTYTHLWKTST